MRRLQCLLIAIAVLAIAHPTGSVNAQETDADKLKEKINELRKQQERLRVEEQRLRAELQQLIESTHDRLKAGFTGTLQHDQDRNLFKVILNQPGQQKVEQTVWVVIHDDPINEQVYKRFIGKRVRVSGELFQHGDQGGKRQPPANALYVLEPSIEEFVRPGVNAVKRDPASSAK